MEMQPVVIHDGYAIFQALWCLNGAFWEKNINIVLKQYVMVEAAGIEPATIFCNPLIYIVRM